MLNLSIRPWNKFGAEIRNKCARTMQRCSPQQPQGERAARREAHQKGGRETGGEKRERAERERRGRRGGNRDGEKEKPTWAQRFIFNEWVGASRGAYVSGGLGPFKLPQGGPPTVQKTRHRQTNQPTQNPKVRNNQLVSS